MKTFFILTSLMVILFLATPNDINAQTTIPSESTVNTYLRSRVESESGGALSLAQFLKTNGYEQGYGIYVIEWQAEILSQQECWKPGNAFEGYWQNFSVVRRQPNTDFSAALAGGPKYFDKGTTIRLKGNATLRKTEKGWRVEGFEVKTSQVLEASKGSIVTQGNNRIYIAPNNEFSYRLPNGSTPRDVSPWKFKAVDLQSIDGATPSITVREGPLSGTLENYLASKVTSIYAELSSPEVQNVRVSKPEEFVTDAKARAFRVVVAAGMDGKPFKITIYLFDGLNGKVYEVSCTFRGQGNVAYDSALDTSMRTFKAPAPTNETTLYFPAGTTFRCKDGTFSDAKTALGACSNHGGVDKRRPD